MLGADTSTSKSVLFSHRAAVSSSAFGSEETTQPILHPDERIQSEEMYWDETLEIYYWQSCSDRQWYFEDPLNRDIATYAGGSREALQAQLNQRQFWWLDTNEDVLVTRHDDGSKSYTYKGLTDPAAITELFEAEVKQAELEAEKPVSKWKVIGLAVMSLLGNSIGLRSLVKNQLLTPGSQQPEPTSNGTTTEVLTSLSHTQPVSSQVSENPTNFAQHSFFDTRDVGLEPRGLPLLFPLFASLLTTRTRSGMGCEYSTLVPSLTLMTLLLQAQATELMQTQAEAGYSVRVANRLEGNDEQEGKTTHPAFLRSNTINQALAPEPPIPVSYSDTRSQTGIPQTLTQPEQQGAPMSVPVANVPAIVPQNQQTPQPSTALLSATQRAPDTHSHFLGTDAGVTEVSNMQKLAIGLGIGLGLPALGAAAMASAYYFGVSPFGRHNVGEYTPVEDEDDSEVSGSLRSRHLEICNPENYQDEYGQQDFERLDLEEVPDSTSLTHLINDICKQKARSTRSGPSTYKQVQVSLGEIKKYGGEWEKQSERQTMVWNKGKNKCEDRALDPQRVQMIKDLPEWMKVYRTTQTSPALETSCVDKVFTIWDGEFHNVAELQIDHFWPFSDILYRISESTEHLSRAAGKATAEAAANKEKKSQQTTQCQEEFERLERKVGGRIPFILRKQSSGSAYASPDDFSSFLFARSRTDNKIYPTSCFLQQAYRYVPNLMFSTQGGNAGAGKGDMNPVQWIKENQETLNLGDNFMKRLNTKEMRGIIPFMEGRALQRVVMDEFKTRNEERVKVKKIAAMTEIGLRTDKEKAAKGWLVAASSDGAISLPTDQTDLDNFLDAILTTNRTTWGKASSSVAQKMKEKNKKIVEAAPRVLPSRKRRRPLDPNASNKMISKRTTLRSSPAP